MSVSLNQCYQYHQNKNLIVIWQAKAACTLVNKMFFNDEGLYEDALQFSSWIHDYRKKHTDEFRIIREEALKNPETKYIQFTINPYKRAVSSYIHAMRTPLIMHSVNNIDGYTFDTNIISFKNWLLMLKNNELKSNNHFDSQCFYINTLTPIEKFKIEHIDLLIPYINNNYGTQYFINSEILHSGHYCIKTESVFFSGETCWKDLSDNIPKNYTLFYNDEIKSLVEIIYQKDLETLNYTWDEFINYYKVN